VVLRSTELRIATFDDVDEAFADDEGEDDRTLESWRDGHRRYFTAEGSFAPDMDLYCERFRLIEVLERSAADPRGSASATTQEAARETPR
jgi:uncharacterized protein YhfF